MKGKIYLIEKQDDKMLGLFMFLKQLCAKMMISPRLELQNL